MGHNNIPNFMTKTTRNHKKTELFAGEPLRIVHEDGLGTYADLTQHQREYLGQGHFDHYKGLFDAALINVSKRQHKLNRALRDLGDAAAMLWSGANIIDYAPADIKAALKNGQITKVKVKKAARAKR